MINMIEDILFNQLFSNINMIEDMLFNQLFSNINMIENQLFSYIIEDFLIHLMPEFFFMGKIKHRTPATEADLLKGGTVCPDLCGG